MRTRGDRRSYTLSQTVTLKDSCRPVVTSKIAKYGTDHLKYLQKFTGPLGKTGPKANIAKHFVNVEMQNIFIRKNSLSAVSFVQEC